MVARSDSGPLGVFAVVALLLAASCGEEPADPTPATTSDGDEEVESEADAEDELLRRARESMKAGQVTGEVRGELMNSEEPEHARARRLLAAVAGDTVPVGDGDPAPKIKVTTSEGTKEITPKPVPSVKPPAANAEAGSGSTAESESASSPQLAVLTRLEMQRKGKHVTLRLHAAQPVELGMVAQKSSATVRLVARSAGALPAVLQARPSKGGVTVTDIRRGEGTIQIAVQLDEGWRASQPKSESRGASVSFKGG